MAPVENDGFPPEFKGDGNDNPWNKDPVVRGNNNCYDYAFNQRQPRPTAEEAEALQKKKAGKLSLPGKKAGAAVKRPYKCDAVTKGVLADNPDLVTESTKDGKCKDGCWKVALMIRNEGTDSSVFHFLRQDADGGWSHKDGSKPATRKDDDGKDIKDPEKAKLDDYKICKYFCVCKGVEVAMAPPPPEHHATVFALLSPLGDDPSFLLAGDSLEELSAKLAGLPPTESRPDYRMGYGGFLIVRAGVRGDLPPFVTVVQGLVSTQTDEGDEQWFEDTNEIEPWLRARYRTWS